MSSPGPTPIPVAERFRRMVTPEPNTGCWLWTGATIRGGYGSIAVKEDGRWVHRLAHRVSWVLDGRPLPAGLQLDHLCRVRCCVNPSHLELVTQTENIRRGVEARRRTHCPKGHELTPDNLKRGQPGRRCKTCAREWMAAHGKRRAAR